MVASRYEFADRDAAKLWIIQNQFGRRNISDFVRAELALQAEPLIAAKAKERMLLGSKIDPSANLQQGKTTDELSSMSGVSARNISKVKNILSLLDGMSLCYRSLISVLQ